MNKSTLWILLGIFVLAGGLIFSFDRKGTFSGKEDSQYKIQSKWELPAILEEVSGIEWLEDNKIAMVQDEDGIIFIYNLATSKIEKKVEFAGPGDYEGITVNGSTAYVVRSDGTIFEISNYQNKQPKTVKFDTFLTEAQNVEGLCFDKAYNRLMLAIKDKDREGYKGVYAFSLSNEKLAKSPIFELDMNDKLIANSTKKLSKRFRPSEIEIHPETGKIYLLDAKNPRMLVMNQKGKFEKVYKLNEDEFNQPEGITFKPDGSLYISNEAGRDPANILEVEFKNN
jgi:uncharacterized protein YjiK